MLLIIPLLTKGQEAVIHFNIYNAKASKIVAINGDYANADILFGERIIEIPLNAGKAKWTQKLSKPGFVNTLYQDSITKKYFTYAFYLSPGDNLDFSIDSKNPEAPYTVKGKGGTNNQPSIQKLVDGRFSHELEAYEKDSLPYNVFKLIKERNILYQKILDEYITANHPTKEFVKTYSLFIRYFPMWTYIDFKGDQKFKVREPFMRNENKWQTIEDSLTKVIPVSNNEALNIGDYASFLRMYLTRIKERVWNHPELLIEYFDTHTQEEAVKILAADPENLLKEKIIIKHFAGRTGEFLYGILFKEAIREKEDNLPEIFTRFKQKYPQSQYIPYIEPAITKIVEQRKRKLTDNMVFVENLESYQTFDNVLKLVAGKTVLLDMWGTWCGPCRSELSLNSDSIKSHFKDKDLDYLYVANYDTGKEAEWKELISYYNLTGTHILATSQLTEDIMTTVKGKGYPTYIIIKKDGTFELSEAGYPMNREILIKQLERALDK